MVGLPLSSCNPQQWSLASLVGPGFCPDFLSHGALAHSGCLHAANCSPPWGLTSEARASVPSPHLPWQASRQVSQAGHCQSTLTLCVGLSLFTLPSAALLLHSPPWLQSSPTPSLPVRGLPSVWKLFLLHSSLSEV